MRSVVDLPQPDGPTKATNSLSAIGAVLAGNRELPGWWGPGRAAIWADAIEAAHTVFDVVAFPSETPLVRAGRDAGKHVITGAEVIALQAARQFERYTGVALTEAQTEICATCHAPAELTARKSVLVGDFGRSAFALLGVVIIAGERVKDLAVTFLAGSPHFAELAQREAGIDVPVHVHGIPKRFLDHASRGQVLEEVGKSARHPLLCNRCEAAVES